MSSFVTLTIVRASMSGSCSNNGSVFREVDWLAGEPLTHIWSFELNLPRMSPDRHRAERVPALWYKKHKARWRSRSSLFAIVGRRSGKVCKCVSWHVHVSTSVLTCANVCSVVIKCVWLCLSCGVKSTWEYNNDMARRHMPRNPSVKISMCNTSNNAAVPICRTGLIPSKTADCILNALLVGAP